MALSTVSSSAKEWGKTAKRLNAIANLIFVVLWEHCTAEQVVEAIYRHSAQSDEIPTPAAINRIVNPAPIKYSETAFIAIQKKISDGNVFVTPEEREYCRAFMRQELEKLNHGKKVIKNAAPAPAALIHAGSESDQ